MEIPEMEGKKIEAEKMEVIEIGARAMTVHRVFGTGTFGSACKCPPPLRCSAYSAVQFPD